MIDYKKLCSWVNDQKAVEAVMSKIPNPYLGQVSQSIKGLGKGKSRFLNVYVEAFNNGVYPTRTQETGDCVSFADAGVVDGLKATEILLGDENEAWEGLTSTEDIYYGSRVLIGKGQLGGQQGSVGAWAVEYSCTYGSLIKKKYPFADLSVYSGQRANEWGKPRFQAPKGMLEAAALHKARQYTLVLTWEELRDSLYSGYPIIICSNQGFSNVRDSQGFAKPNDVWPHALLCIGYTEETGRPGALIVNSWGVWNSGPRNFSNIPTIPEGSFFVDAQVIEKKMLSARDSWSLSGFNGYQPQDLDFDISKRAAERYNKNKDLYI